MKKDLIKGKFNAQKPRTFFAFGYLFNGFTDRDDSKIKILNRNFRQSPYFAAITTQFRPHHQRSICNFKPKPRATIGQRKKLVR